MAADEPVVAASVIKVLIAIAAEIAFEEGRLDPRRPLRLCAAQRTPGPVGFSLFSDDVVASSRDLVSAMLTISDNVAADALLTMVGLDTCNRLAASLGLASTVIVSTLADMVTSIAQDAGFADWASMTAWTQTAATEDDREAVDRRIRQSAALDPTRATRTTARDMGTLLQLIWENQAGPPAACARIRAHMGRQLTRNRLASAFPAPAQVAAKSGGLVGVVRNEVGVIERPGNDRFYVAVFTRSEPAATELDINTAIGKSAARAVQALDA